MANVLLGPGISKDAIEELGHIRHLVTGVSYDVSPANPERMDQMTLAVVALLGLKLPLENEAIKEYFQEIVTRYARKGVPRHDEIEYPTTISDFIATVKNEGDHVGLEYAETAGRGDVGKFFWSLGRWLKPSIVNWFRRKKGERAGLFYSLLMKLRILPSIEDNLVFEIRNLLNRGVANRVFGRPTTYKPSEWIVDSTSLGRDIIIRPIDAAGAGAVGELSEADRELAGDIEEALARLLDSRGYATVKTVRQVLVGGYDRPSVGRARVSRCLPAVLEAHGLVSVHCTRRLKDRLGIESTGYPKIIMRADHLAAAQGTPAAT